MVVLLKVLVLVVEYFGIDEQLGFRGDYVTFLRDPVARVVSFWKHQQTHRHAAFHAQVKAGMTLREFVNSCQTLQTDNHMTRILVGSCAPGMLDGAMKQITFHSFFLNVTFLLFLPLLLLLLLLLLLFLRQSFIYLSLFLLFLLLLLLSLLFLFIICSSYSLSFFSFLSFCSAPPPPPFGIKLESNIAFF